MVNPILIFAVALAGAFLLPLLRRLGPTATLTAAFGIILFLAFVPISHLPSLLTGGPTVEVVTGGAAPPLAINLRLGVVEAVVLSLVNLVAVGSLVRLTGAFRRNSDGGAVLFVLMVMGANGIVMTRDLFNTFVFLEIMSIATYGLLVVGKPGVRLQAAFKYVVAGGLASALFLLGVILLYRDTGTLNLDAMIAARAAGNAAADAPGAAGVGGAAAGVTGFGGSGVGVFFVGSFLLLAAVLIELKPFPANGWALDVYQAAHPGVAASISASTASAVIVVLYKIVPLLDSALLSAVSWIGVGTFVAANVMGLNQTDERRMLGYSSVAQIGLVAFVIGQAAASGWQDDATLRIAGGLLVNHLLAKAGLFWTTGGDEGDGRAARPAARRPAGYGVRASRWATAILVFALIGLPPFPAFWAKWELMHILAGAGGAVVPMILVLVASLFEALYLLRWFGRRAGLPRESEPVASSSGATTKANVAADFEFGAAPAVDSPWRVAPTLLVAAVVVGLGAVVGVWAGDGASGWVARTIPTLLFWLPPAAIIGFALLSGLPTAVNSVLGVAAMGWFAVRAYPFVTGLGAVFLGVFAIGGVLVLIAAMHRSRRPSLVVATVVGATGALIAMTAASSTVEFFFAWETLTAATYLLVVQSRRSAGAALRYAAFSLGGALAILAGLALLAGVVVFGASPGETAGTLSVGQVVTAALGTIGGDAADGGAGGVAGAGGFSALAGLVLLAAGFLAKAGAVGVHLWLPDAYGAVEEEGGAFFSALVSKAAVFGLVVVGGGLAVAGGLSGGGAEATASSITFVLADWGAAVIGWIGVATALFGALLAVFQEDAKQLLAYSSMSQVGYIVLGIAAMSHLGWVSGLYLTVLHAIFKIMLFVALAGVVARTGTSEMYRLGGLIKRMPVTFVSVLMAIIAVSGVPPLAGFGGKWLLYTALVEKGWYLQAGLAFFASAVAFLYLFRLIHTIFLGQLKDEHRHIREAPATILIPQAILIAGLMAVSMFPSILISPLIEAVEPYFAATIAWQDYTVISSLGYWNGNLVMYVTMGVFALPLIWLVVVMRRPQHVEQFNIVYAAERPERPETTHFAHNFFAPYRRALGFAVTPLARRFWSGASAAVVAVGSAVRRIYTGNGQTYALHIVLFLVILYLAVGGFR